MLKKKARKYSCIFIKSERNACQNRFSITLIFAGLARCYQNCFVKSRRAKSLRVSQKFKLNLMNRILIKETKNNNNDNIYAKLRVTVLAQLNRSLFCEGLASLGLGAHHIYGGQFLYLHLFSFSILVNHNSNGISWVTP